MQKRTPARNKLTEPQRGAPAPQGRGSREFRVTGNDAPIQVGSGEVTLGGHADRGLTLEALYETGALGRLRLDVRMRLVADLTQSLAWLHANQRLMAAQPHLLITPSTIVIGLDGVARVDVRAARKISSENGKAETSYLAPEVVNGDPSADHRADIYSVGVLCWEALAGRRIDDTEDALPQARTRGRGGDGSEGIPSDVPAALGGGARAERDTGRRGPRARPAPKPSYTRLKVPPPLELPVEAEWLVPFAQVVLQAISYNPAERPQDCRPLLMLLDALDPAHFATQQEIADVIQGLNTLGTLCVPEPTLPTTDASCQEEPGTPAMLRSAHRSCEATELEQCSQPRLPEPRRVPQPHLPEPEPEPTPVAVAEPIAQPRPAPATSGWRALMGQAGSMWFIGVLMCIALLGSLAGYIAATAAAP